MASRSINKVILVGNLGKDAETKFTPSGVARTLFTVATNRRWKDQSTGDWKDETEWHNVVLWRSENLANYLLKGKQVYVEGRLASRSYDDKDGNKRYITEIVADEVILLSGGSRGEGGGDEYGSGMSSMPRSARREQPAQQPSYGGGTGGGTGGGGFEPGITDDDVPF
ncbi:MAG TPA: single-stranded DNA-binding protein [Bryobacteraceae bacterium]|nr:single-stranded DNA-binding protein [Bryobacteraceae bacterium]